MSQVDFRFRHMLSSKVPSSHPAHLYRHLSSRKGRKQNFSIHTSFRVVPQSLCRSGLRHPKCHCSWNTVKCFCSCCCPLKILAASMTAVEDKSGTSIHLPAGTKDSSGGHCRAGCLAYLRLCNKRLRRRASFWSQNILKVTFIKSPAFV